MTFHGWLAEQEGDVYRFFTSSWFDEWLEIKAADLVFQIQTPEYSTIWVKREAHVNKCQSAEACHFAEQEATDATDTATAFPGAVRRRYP